MNDQQQDTYRRLIDPSLHRGGTSTTTDTVLSINGVKVVLYPSGKIDILAVDESELAREAEAAIRERYGELILNHVRTYRRSDEHLLAETERGILTLTDTLRRLQRGRPYRVVALEQALEAFERLHKRTESLPAYVRRAAGLEAARSRIQRPTVVCADTGEEL